MPTFLEKFFSPKTQDLVVPVYFSYSGGINGICWVEVKVPYRNWYGETLLNAVIEAVDRKFDGQFLKGKGPEGEDITPEQYKNSPRSEIRIIGSPWSPAAKVAFER